MEKKPPEVSIGQCYDSFSSPPHDVQFVPITAIKSVAYVLPSINYDDKDRSNYNKYFQENIQGHKDFLVVKPIELWK